MNALTDSFNKCERSNSTEDLITISEIIQTIIFFAEHELLQILLDDENYILTFGALEYCASAPITNQHREFMKSKAKYSSVITFKDSQRLDEIHFNFRLQYLRDSAVAHILDDSTLNFMNLLHQRLNKSIIQHIVSNREILSQLSSALGDKDYAALVQVYEMFQAMKSIDAFLDSEVDIYTQFTDIVIFDILESFLRNYDKPATASSSAIPAYPLHSRLNKKKKPVALTESQLELIPQMIAHIFIQYAQNKPALLMRYLCSNEQKFQKYRCFELLCENLMRPRFTSSAIYFSDLIKLILEQTVQKDSSNNTLLLQFSQVHLPAMLTAFSTADLSETNNNSRLLLLDLLSSILRYAINSEDAQIIEALVKIPPQLELLLTAQHKHIISAIIRFFIEFMESNNETLQASVASALRIAFGYVKKVIRNKRNLIYSEVIRFFRIASTITEYEKVLQELNTELQEDRVYQQFMKDIQSSIATLDAVENSSSLFHIDSLKIHYNSSKRYQAMSDEVDIDFIRKKNSSSGGSSPASPQQAPSSSSSKSKFSDSSDDEGAEVIRKRLKSSRD